MVSVPTAKTKNVGFLFGVGWGGEMGETETLVNTQLLRVAGFCLTIAGLLRIIGSTAAFYGFKKALERPTLIPTPKHSVLTSFMGQGVWGLLMGVVAIFVGMVLIGLQGKTSGPR